MNALTRNPITLFGRTNFRHIQKPFGIRRDDRLSHMYVVGKTGTGKSTLLKTMIRQDLARGEGLALLDPHGDLVEQVLDAVPDERQKDLVYFNVPDTDRPMGFNPLAGVPPSARPLAASGILQAFQKIWVDSWGPRMEYILRHALLALLDNPGSTLADVLRLFNEKGFRKWVCHKVTNPQVREYWLREFEGYTTRLRAEAIAPIQNKVGAFLSSPVLRNIVTQPRNAFDPRAVMDEGKILLVNLSKGQIGEDNAALLGALLVSRLGLAALGRADATPQERKPFFLYLDEFQTFTTLSLANMVAELRKYGMGLVMAHQYSSQLSEEVRDAILGNAGTMVSFRVGPEDAELLEGEFSPEIRESDLLSLPNYHFYVKLMVNGVVSRPFSADVLQA